MDVHPIDGRAEAAWEAERGQRTLETGVLVFRWAAFIWMVVLAVAAEPFRRPLLVWGMMGVVGVWTAWLTSPRNRARPAAVGFDLAIAVGLVLVTGLAVRHRGLIGDAPFYATPYPFSAILVWGLTRGVVGGLGAGVGVGLALVATRPLNGVALADLTSGQIQGLATSVVLFIIGGGTVGLVARLLRESARQIRAATEAALEARERAARMAERQVLLRRIHDSILQALTLIQKRGREMEQWETVPGRDVAELTRLAAEQQRELRRLIVRQGEDEPDGTTTLRSAVEDAVGGMREVTVEITGLGAVRLSTDRAGELGAAVRQALENVERHAQATRVTLHIDADDGWASVSVRDDGRGFRYDEQAFRAAGKLGILASMKGRVEDLGGAMRVDTAPGAGTDVEFRVPLVESP